MSSSPKPMKFLILACVALVGGGGTCYWQYSQLQEAQAQADTLDGKLKNAQAIQAQLQDSVGKLKESSEKLKHLEGGVPELAYIPTLLTELENVGKAHGIQVLGVRPIPPKAEPKEANGTPKPKKAYAELDIEVKGRGRYPAVLQFLSALQTFPKIVAVRTTTLTPKRELNDKGAPNLDVTVELRTYLFPPDKNEVKLATSSDQTPQAPAPSATPPAPIQPQGGPKPNGVG